MSAFKVKPDHRLKSWPRMFLSGTGVVDYIQGPVSHKFIGMQPLTMLFMAALALWQQSGVTVTETAWSAKSEMFNNWPFTENVCRPLL